MDIKCVCRRSESMCCLYVYKLKVNNKECYVFKSVRVKLSLMAEYCSQQRQMPSISRKAEIKPIKAIQSIVYIGRYLHIYSVRVQKHSGPDLESFALLCPKSRGIKSFKCVTQIY